MSTENFENCEIAYRVALARAKTSEAKLALKLRIHRRRFYEARKGIHASWPTMQKAMLRIAKALGVEPAQIFPFYKEAA